jgi:hypothetical protein
MVLQDGQSSSAKTKLNNMAGNAEKLAGNASFKAGQWVEAIGHYSRAITKVRAVGSLRAKMDMAWTGSSERDLLPEQGASLPEA